MLNLYQLHQLIKEPTRVTPASKTLIDLVITNKPGNYLQSGVLHIGISDHSMIYACRKISTPNNMQVITTRSLKNYDKNKFGEELKQYLGNYELTVLIQMNFGNLGNLFSILSLKSTHQLDYEKLEANTRLG